MNTCPFCDYAGPSPILADYGDVIVFKPLDPIVEGHLLVVPKDHVRDASGNCGLAGRVFQLAALEAGHRYVSWNLITSAGREATQTVFHLHVHIVPRREGDGLALPWSP